VKFIFANDLIINMDFGDFLSIASVALFVLFVVSMIIRLFFSLNYHLPLTLFKTKAPVTEQHPVSVIICARNELKNLKKNLRLILEQKYPEFQVIVVNDCSWDESEAYLKELSSEYKHLKVITLHEQERHKHGKKFAITIGIKGAQYDYLLFTDADCVPEGPNWIEEMAGQFRNGKEIVIGYGAYAKEKGFTALAQRLDTVMNAITYLSFAIRNQAYMGVGRNLSYRKELFFRSKGFATHYHLLSGDDDLFVNESANPKNVAVNLNKSAFTYSSTKDNFRDWLNQKRRHITTGHRYKLSHRLLLILLPLSIFFSYTCFILLLILKLFPIVTVTVFGIHFFLHMILTANNMKKLGAKDLIWIFPLYELFAPIFYTGLAGLNLISKTKNWK